MQREIKFRGKRLDNGEWVYGDLIHEKYGTCIQYIETEYPKGNGAPERELIFKRHIFKRHKTTVIPATIGQYTGLKDKNGVEIYEGDILACGDGMVPTEIKWHEESHAYYAYSLKRHEYHRLDKHFLRFIGELIGNIYENPDLIEGGAD